ncbi:MAG: hypothetical protein KC636_32980, partial [Myxococcales bacterium]|nr:hypothetical protein [Myxococcales bacterium]
QSHDSLAWTKVVEAVDAAGVLGQKDLRDLTAEKLFKPIRDEADGRRDDPSIDHVRFFAEHRSEPHRMELQVWRDPALGVAVVADTLLAAATADGQAQERVGYEALLDRSEPQLRARPEHRARLLEDARDLSEIALVRDERGTVAVFSIPDEGEREVVFSLSCGPASCPDDLVIAERLVDVITAYRDKPGADARDLLQGKTDVRYTKKWSIRGRAAEHLLDRAFTRDGAPAERAATVRIRAWRDTDEGATFLRDAALRSIGARVSEATGFGSDDAPEDSERWLHRDDEAFSVVASYPSWGLTVLLECGVRRCADEDQAIALARGVEGRAPAAARDRRRLGDLLASADLDGWQTTPVEADEDRPHEYDSLRLDATVHDGSHSAAVWLWRDPEGGVDGQLARLREELDLTPDESFAPGGLGSDTTTGYERVFANPETAVVIRVQCNRGLCPDPGVANALARRAAEKAKDTTNFVDAEAERPYPYVPRGHVKGRADRIWLPLRRFWLPIR